MTNSARALLTLALVMFALLPSCSLPTPSADTTADIDFSAIDRAVEAAIERGDVPGAVVIVGRGDDVLYRRAFGKRMLNGSDPLQPDDIFDFASLTKPIATATAMMKLIQRGDIALTDPAAKYLPGFGTRGKDAITIEQLLLHRSGLIADNALSDYTAGPKQAWQNICDLPLRHDPGERFVYSDVGYIVLAKLVEAVDGRSVDVFCHQEIFEPLGMTATRFTPPADWADRLVPTSVTGRVHDPRAARLDGVAGHAGLFSSAEDLATYCRMILAGGTVDGVTVLEPTTVANMTRVCSFDDGARTRGFDADTRYSSVRGQRFGRGTTFGHTGFTGTMVWLDPIHDIYVIVLASRLQMEGGGATMQMRRAVTTAAAEALLGPAPEPVLTGIDVLVRDKFKQLAGRRIGLITNHTGRAASGKRTIDLLHEADNVDLVAIFSPEHGLAGNYDEKVGHGREAATGLPVWSLYGETRRPTERMLAGLDTLVFDIQDIGTRFYTYISTMGQAMEAAAKHGLRFVVLDRPNPIAPLGADGPLADADRLSFTAYAPIPVTHGLTPGELASWFNQTQDLGCDLHVVEMANWSRDRWWDETHLRWVNPSPNMRALNAAAIYPGLGLLEFTNLSVGRGTDQPFEWFGAPWIDGDQLASALNHADLPGLRFHPFSITPSASKYAGESCGGAQIEITDRNRIEPTRTGLTIARTLRRLYPEWQPANVLKLLANQHVHEAWQQVDDPADLPTLWRDDLRRFGESAAKVRIYD